MRIYKHINTHLQTCRCVSTDWQIRIYGQADAHIRETRCASASGGERWKKFLLVITGCLLTFVEQFETQVIMDRTKIENALFPGCPIRNVLSRIGDKWSLLTLYTLQKRGKAAIRFKELQREIPDISQKMLTVTLRTLEEDGYVTRTIYPEVPPRVEYAITERTQSLLPHINALIGWAIENMDAIMTSRRSACSKSR